MSNIRTSNIECRSGRITNIEQGIWNDDVFRTERIFNSCLFLVQGLINDQSSTINAQCSSERQGNRRTDEQGISNDKVFRE